jgi:hypothetical protein
MQLAFPPFSIGSIVAVVVILFAVLMMAGVLPMTPLWVGGLFVLCGIARIT